MASKTHNRKIKLVALHELLSDEIVPPEHIKAALLLITELLCMDCVPLLKFNEANDVT